METNANMSLNLIHNRKHTSPSMGISDSRRGSMSKNVNRVTIFQSHETRLNRVFNENVPPNFPEKPIES